MCSSRKNPYRGGGVLKAKLLQAKYEAKLEFTGWGGEQNKKLFLGGSMDIFSDCTICLEKLKHNKKGRTFHKENTISMHGSIMILSYCSSHTPLPLPTYMYSPTLQKCQFCFNFSFKVFYPLRPLPSWNF